MEIKGWNVMTTCTLLENQTARTLYEKAEKLPIIDYHCHLSPREIFEDRPFENIGEMWLGADHYKWRLMRSAGIDERFITGGASWHEKFLMYAQALEFAAGNPLYVWSHMELSRFFGIETPLRRDTAEAVWQQANGCIREKRLSPRKLMAQSHVDAVCTTDDMTDSLTWHEKLRQDPTFDITVLPSFRTDSLLLMERPGYAAYVRKLSEASGIPVTDLAGLKAACEARLDDFVRRGCRVTDVGIPFFPDTVASPQEADAVFRRLLAGERVPRPAYLGLIGHLYVFLSGLYRQRNLVMQMHLAVRRNANTDLFRRAGADCGGDTVGDPLRGDDLIGLLDAMNEAGGLPETILYTLNESSAAQVAAIAGAFPRVRCGAAWWFCDHKRGILTQLHVMAENGCLGVFPGMLTDSRSFLSYARHDYFRRILCTLVGSWVEKGEYDPDSAAALVRKLSYDNTRALLGMDKGDGA